MNERKKKNPTQQLNLQNNPKCNSKPNHVVRPLQFQWLNPTNKSIKLKKKKTRTQTKINQEKNLFTTHFILEKHNQEKRKGIDHSIFLDFYLFFIFMNILKYFTYFLFFIFFKIYVFLYILKKLFCKQNLGPIERCQLVKFDIISIKRKVIYIFNDLINE